MDVAIPPGKIFLSDGSKIVAEFVAKQMVPETRAPTMSRIADFDDVTIDLLAERERLEEFRVVVSFERWSQIAKYNGDELLREKYGAFYEPMDTGFAVHVNMSAVSEDQLELVDKVSKAKDYAFGALFYKAIKALLAGKQAALEPMKVNFQKDDATYIMPSADRIVVFYEISYEDQTDRATAEVLCKEFQEAESKVPDGPFVSFHKKAPPMLQSLATDRSSDPSFVGYLGFAVLPDLCKAGNEEKLSLLLASFRTYIHYHLKATKSYLHARMRARVDNFLQVLNRAHRPDPFAKKEKKTITGRTMTQRKKK